MGSFELSLEMLLSQMVQGNGRISGHWWIGKTHGVRRHLGGWHGAIVPLVVGHQRAWSQNHNNIQFHVHQDICLYHNWKDIKGSIGKDAEKLESSHTATGDGKWGSCFVKWSAGLKHSSTWPSSSTLKYVPERKTCVRARTDTQCSWRRYSQ